MSQFSSVTQLCLTLCNPVDCSTPGFPVHHQLSEIAQTHVHWVSDAIQPSHPFSCLQSFPASGSFPMSQFFTSGGQSTGVSASASILPVNIQDWFPSGLTGLILQSKELSRAFSNGTVQKRQLAVTSYQNQLPVIAALHCERWTLREFRKEKNTCHLWLH